MTIENTPSEIGPKVVDYRAVPRGHKTVGDKIVCRQCGSDLTGQPLQGHCRTCNLLVEISALNNWLADADPHWLQMVRRSIFWMFISVGATALLVFVQSTTFSVHFALSPLKLSLHFLFCCCVWQFTSEEGLDDETSPILSKTWLRRLVIVDHSLRIARVTFQPTFYLLFEPKIYFITFEIGLTAMSAMVDLMLILQLRQICRRLPDHKLEQFTKITWIVRIGMATLNTFSILIALTYLVYNLNRIVFDLFRLLNKISPYCEMGFLLLFALLLNQYNDALAKVAKEAVKRRDPAKAESKPN